METISKRVFDLDLKEYPVLPSTAPISKAVRVMQEEEVSSIVVVDDGEYRGMVSIQRILGSRLRPNSKIDNVITKTPVVSRNINIFEMAFVMSRLGLTAMPILKSKKEILVVDALTLSHALSQTPQLENLLVEDVMETAKWLSPMDTISKAKKMLVDEGIHSIPIVSDDRIVGILVARDIAALVFTTPYRRQTMGEVVGEQLIYLGMPVRSIMMHPVYTTKTLTYLSKAVQEMVQRNISALPVLNSEDKLVGLLSTKAIIRYASTLLPQPTLPVSFRIPEDLDPFVRSLIERKIIDLSLIHI